MKKLKLYQGAVLNLLWINAVTTIFPLQTDAAEKFVLGATIIAYCIGLFTVGGDE